MNAKTKYCIWLTKQNDLKYLSHHDVAQILEQAIRRSNIPVCMSGRFNPRPKISFFSSVPVGVSSQSEPIELLLNQDIPEQQILQSLHTALPHNLDIIKVEKIEKRETYCLEIFYTIKIGALVPDKTVEWMNQPSFWISRSRKDKVVQVDIRPFVKECRMEILEGMTFIYVTTIMTSKGSVSPWEILSCMDIPMDGTYLIDITRTAVFNSEMAVTPPTVMGEAH